MMVNDVLVIHIFLPAKEFLHRDILKELGQKHGRTMLPSCGILWDHYAAGLNDAPWLTPPDMVQG